MKVAHLTTADVSLRLLLFAQLCAVRDAGGEAIGISAPGPFVAELERAGIRHIPLTSSTRSSDPIADMRAARELYGILRRERVDVLHTHNPKPGLYGRVVGRLARVPVIVNTVHGLYATEDDAWTRRGPVYALEAVAARFSDAELVQNPEDLALMQRLHLTKRAPARERRRPRTVRHHPILAGSAPRRAPRSVRATTPSSSAQPVAWWPRRDTRSCSRQWLRSTRRATCW